MTEILPLVIQTSLSLTKTADSFTTATKGMMAVSSRRTPMATAYLQREKGLTAEIVGPSHDEWEPAVALAGRLAMNLGPIKDLSLKDTLANLQHVMADRGEWRASWQILLDREINLSNTLYIHQAGLMLLPNLNAMPWSDELATSCISHDSMDWHSPEWPQGRFRCAFIFSTLPNKSAHDSLTQMSAIRDMMELFAATQQTPVVVKDAVRVGTLLGLDMTPF